MSRLLAIAFDDSELGSFGGFAKALGVPYDLIQITGVTGPSGAEKHWVAGLDTVPPADGLAKALASIADGYAFVAAISSMRSKDILPRLATRLNGPMVTDAIAVDGPNRYRRPIVAGALIATVEVDGSPTVFTFRPTAFPTVDPSPAGTVESITLATESSVIVVQAATHTKAGRPDLTQAKVVVSGGRPLKDATTFESVIGGLADALGGAVGATRAAVDSGIAPNEAQVGQTGKIVAPDLYIAAGVSGSTQHLAGMKDSKVIVAINTDGDAPIFSVADLGLVEDLYTAIPKLREALGK